MTSYRRLDTDPPAIVAFGATREELFEHAAWAMYDIAYDLSDVPSTYSRPVVAPGDDDPELLCNWLDEVLYVGGRTGLVWSSFFVDRLEEGGVQGSAGGMPAVEVPPRRTSITGVESVPSGLVPVPDGWWAEIRFRAAPRLVPV